MKDKDLERFNKLSKGAKRKYNQLCAGRWERVKYHEDSKYIKELKEAGFIKYMMRPAVWYACYVPAGTKPAKDIVLPEAPPIEQYTKPGVER